MTIKSSKIKKLPQKYLIGKKFNLKYLYVLESLWHNHLLSINQKFKKLYDITWI